MNSSRLRKNPTHIFDCFLEIAYPQDSFISNPAKGHLILQTFPVSFKNQAPDWLRKVPEFVFPCSQLYISTVQNFSFVLTNAQSQWTFGFCRVAPGAETALVMISSLQWHEIFYRILNRAAEIVLRSRDDGELWRFLEAIYNAKVPDYTAPLHISWLGSGDSVADLSFTVPSKFGLPAIPENRNLTEYYNACGIEVMYGVFAAMLKERRIIITSNKLPKLSACVQAANTLLFPMHWQHIFIPILPKTMIEYVEAPMPFLIGVPAPLMQDLMASSQSEIVIVDADSGKIKNPYDDVGSLPMEITNNFNRCLRNRHEHGGDAIPRAFLQALVHLIGGYRDALKQRPDEPISFDGKVFVSTRNQSLQPFLQEMLDLQIFRQFIEERIETLSRGKSLSDEFEREVMRFSEKDSSSHSGARIVKKQFEHMKKEGGAILGIVKERSNPVMKSVRETGKQAIRDIKHKSKRIKSRNNHNQQRSISPSSFSVGPTEDLPQLTSGSPSFGNRRTLSVSNVNTGGSSQDRNTEAGDSSRNSSSSGLSRYNTEFGFGGRVLKYERFDPPPVGSLVSSDLPSFKVEGVNNTSPTLDLKSNFTPGALERSPEMEAPAKLNLDLMKDLQDFIQFNPPPAINRDLKPVAQNSRMLLSPDIQNSCGEVEIAAGGTVRNVVDGPIPPLRPKLERTFKSKPEPTPVQDLIALGDSVDDDFFDPLMTSKTASSFFPTSNLAKQPQQAPLPRPPSANVASITQFYENQQKTSPLGDLFGTSSIPFHETNGGGILTNGSATGDHLRSFQASIYTKSSEDLLQEYGLNFGALNVNQKPLFSSSLSPTVSSLSNEKIVDIFDPIQINSTQPGAPQHTPLIRSRVSTSSMNFGSLATGGPVAPPRAKKPSTEGWTKFD